jgi:RHS repeat-associated protein
MAAPASPSRAVAGGAPAANTSGVLAAAKMSLATWGTRASLATKAVISALSPPSEFSRLASQFEEPLIASGATSAQEDAALLKALQRYHGRTHEDDFATLTAFLSQYPSSAWRVALLTNLGLLNYHYGYFSRAIDAWQDAWETGKAINEPRVRALVDRAVGELARMHARLGHADQLDALFKELGDRHVSGPATEAIAGAREGLSVMRTDPGIAYLCGPMALKNLLIAEHRPTSDVAFLDKVRSGPHGVTLSEVSELADKAKLPHRVVFRTLDQPVPVPSIIHWKVSHFAAIVGENGTRFHIIDPTFGTDLWITKPAIDAESDGYFLVANPSRAAAWREASVAETAQVRGMGYPGGVEAGATTPQDCNCGGPTSPMATYSFTEMVVSLHITDTPVGYAPARGPSVKVTLNYNQREAYQPANFNFFNVSQKWTLNWLSYIQDDPNYPGANVARYVAGGGLINYTQQCNYVTGVCEYYNPTTGVFPAETRDASVLSRTVTGPIVYRRALADGSMEVYSASNGATTYPRLVFLTQITDPAGNTVSLSYDNQHRLTSITDATGRLTTFTYGLTSNPLLVTKITDPFGRSAEFAYDSMGRLAQITDILGLKSQFTYDSSSLIDTMTTPYGTSTFTYGQNGTYRFLTATDPLGHTERLEWDQPAPDPPIPFYLPTNLIPVGIINPFNEYITGRDTFYWDKHAYAVAAGNYAMARLRHWMHLSLNSNEMYHAIESYQYPLENRVWMNYPGQPNTGFSGTLDRPSRVGRVLDDGTTQLSQMTYNNAGHVTDTIDPVGRETQFTYDTNQIDLLTVQQRTSASSFATIAQFTYNSQHLPLTYTNAAGQTTNLTYNTDGQITQMKDALGEATSYEYNGLGYLTEIVNANGQKQVSFTYDSYGRVATATDSEGYTIAYAYDAADRVTQETFPDGTTTRYAWTNLDLTSVTDRQGNTTHYAYDGVRDLVSTTDPLDHVTRLGYWENQSLKTLTDPNGNTTTWNIDVQNRVTGKQYADGSQVTNAYENTTSRLHSITDALGQIKQFSYGVDDTLKDIAYSQPVHPTPNVSFAYDPYFRRIASMTDGNGTRAYSYEPVGAPGALQLLKETGPYSNDSITYHYDQLSRLSARTVDTSTESFAYDRLSRLVSHGTALGTFNLSYLGQTGQITGQQSSTGTVGTTWQYDTNTNDRRLKAIDNSGATRSFNYTTTPESLITQIQETAPKGSAWAPKTWSYDYDDAYRLTKASTSAGTYGYGLDSAGNITSFESPSGSTTAGYNNLNQLRDFGSRAYVYDRNGNVLDDGLRTYTWDAENRLLSVTSKANSALKTTFRYDGLGRRTEIDATNGMTTETRYLWCGDHLCQARTSTDTVSRRYYSEGEYLPLGGTSLYYSQDQLGSVRDVLATQNGSRVGSFDYDPYGNPSESNDQIGTNFRYAGMLYDQQDGLYLTRFRVYDPQTARWVLRDPSGPAGGVNVYSFVNGNPVSRIDSTGLASEDSGSFHMHIQGEEGAMDCAIPYWAVVLDSLACYASEPDGGPDEPEIGRCLDEKFQQDIELFCQTAKSGGCGGSTSDPNAPFGPDNPNTPFGVNNPNTPFGPANPNTPFGPANPNTPFGPANPNTPFGPANPNTPFGPANPNTPFGPANPNTPFGPANPNTPFGPANPRPIIRICPGNPACGALSS